MTLQKIKNGWALFKEAVAGDGEIDYTEGSIGRVTVMLAIPMILEMAMESIFAVVDIFFVAGLGTAAVATVGLTEAMITLLYAIAIGLSMGTTALIARRIGEKDTNAASLVAGQAIWIGSVVSVVVGLVGVFYAKNILMLMGADEAVLETGESYTRIMFGSCFTIVFLFLINAIFRGAGDASLAMRALTLANCINIVLDPCLIYGYGSFPRTWYRRCRNCYEYWARRRRSLWAVLSARWWGENPSAFCESCFADAYNCRIAAYLHRWCVTVPSVYC